MADDVAKCGCPDWEPNMRKLNAPHFLQAVRTGGHGYDGKWFAFCPWCGKPLEGRAARKIDPMTDRMSKVLELVEEEAASIADHWAKTATVTTVETGTFIIGGDGIDAEKEFTLEHAFRYMIEDPTWSAAELESWAAHLEEFARRLCSLAAQRRNEGHS